MSYSDRKNLQLRTFLVADLIGASAVLGGCSPEGAGTIHIDSPKAKKQMMQTGAGSASTATSKPVPSAKTQMPVPGSANNNPTSKNR